MLEGSLGVFGGTCAIVVVTSDTEVPSNHDQ